MSLLSILRTGGSRLSGHHCKLTLFCETSTTSRHVCVSVLLSGRFTRSTGVFQFLNFEVFCKRFTCSRLVQNVCSFPYTFPCLRSPHSPTFPKDLWLLKSQGTWNYSVFHPPPSLQLRCVSPVYPDEYGTFRTSNGQLIDVEWLQITCPLPVRDYS